MITAVAFLLGWTARVVQQLVQEKMRLHALHNMQAPARTDPDQLTLL